MKLDLAASISGTAGAVFTLVTGLVEHTPSQLLGATWYGYPLPWLYRMVLAPEYYPWRFDFTSLLLDALFWTLISSGILFLALRFRTTIKMGALSRTLGAAHAVT